MISLVHATPLEIIQLDDGVGVDSLNPDVTREGALTADMPMTAASPRQMTRLSPAKVAAKSTRPSPLA